MKLGKAAFVKQGGPNTHNKKIVAWRKSVLETLGTKIWRC